MKWLKNEVEEKKAWNCAQALLVSTFLVLYKNLKPLQVGGKKTQFSDNPFCPSFAAANALLFLSDFEMRKKVLHPNDDLSCVAVHPSLLLLSQSHQPRRLFYPHLFKSNAFLFVILRHVQLCIRRCFRQVILSMISKLWIFVFWVWILFFNCW